MHSIGAKPCKPEGPAARGLHHDESSLFVSLAQQDIVNSTAASKLTSGRSGWRRSSPAPEYGIGITTVNDRPVGSKAGPHVSVEHARALSFALRDVLLMFSARLFSSLDPLVSAFSRVVHRFLHFLHIPSTMALENGAKAAAPLDFGKHPTPNFDDDVEGEDYHDSIRGHTRQDHADMLRMGKKQELTRNYRPLSALAFTVILQGTWEVLMT
jgi:hypothetical protein